ncbi:unnamed protein product [Owenia fusiformis]|uniref:Protein kinase domain-containing protein n=1 Tax=Owenia fusiformis TaxID=6347 RepID=A0A8S4NF85_OWEFU|nr:unnamed protein product [Owenia fusiformis]
MSQEKENESPSKERMTVLEAHGFQLGKSLGYGSYATVKAAHSTKHDCKVAIKIVSKRRAPPDYIAKFLPREIEVVKILKHPNLVCFLQSIETTNRVYFIMELAGNGDLLDVIKREGVIPEQQAGIWFHQLVAGIAYCHRKGVVHRDLKCENVLLDSRNNLKITDFGFARGGMKPGLDGKRILSETYCGSYAYAPPEILKGIPYEPQVADIWSTGVILFTMVCGRLPYDDSNHKTLLRQVQSKIVFPSKINLDTDLKDLIQNILVKCQERITIQNIRRHPWFTKVAPDSEICMF